MEEKFVTYDIALKLKELGFNEGVCAYFKGDIYAGDNTDGVFCWWGEMNKHGGWPVIENDSIVPAPLWQDAEDWLLKKHKICIEYIFDDCLWEARLGKFTLPDFVPDEVVYLEETSETITDAIEDKPKIRKLAILKAIEMCQVA